MYFRCKWGRRKITSLNWLERCKGLCDIDYYRAILEDDVTHERQPFYLNVFVYMINFEKKNHNIQTTYHWVTGVEVYIIWYAFFLYYFHILFFRFTTVTGFVCSNSTKHTFDLLVSWFRPNKISFEL